MTIVFLPPAAFEAEEAYSHYEDKQPGLGAEFAAELEAALGRIERSPGSWTPIGPDLRKCRLDRFPYHVIYAVEGATIVIAAVAHDRRRPGYWRDRR